MGEPGNAAVPPRWLKWALIALIPLCILFTVPLLYFAVRKHRAPPPPPPSMACHLDHDGDGYGAEETTVAAGRCPPVAERFDCDDGNAEIHPGAAEHCDGRDEDCDGRVDELPVDAPVWYADHDGDGYGDPGSPMESCLTPAGAVADGTDCDDGSKQVHPGAREIPENGVDDDCDDSVDEPSGPATPTPPVSQVRCPDADGDGFGARPAGSERGAGNCTDCDDGNAAIHPWARELCNGIDDDCDGVVDPPDASSAPLWYPDADGDGYTLHTDHVRGCTCPAGYARKSTKKDCDDGHALVHPGAHDQPDNGIDEDCSGADATTRDRDVAVRIRSGEASREEVVAYVDDADDRRRLGDVPVPDPGMRDRLVEFVLHEGPAGIHKLYDKTVNGLSFLTHSDIVKEDCARRVLEARRRPEGDPPKCPTAPLQYYLTQDRTWCVPKELDSCEAETRTHQDGRKP